MKCECGADSKVVDTRLIEGKQKRRRVCMGCGKRFNTYEIYERDLPKQEEVEEEKPKEAKPKNKTPFVPVEVAKQIKEKKRHARHAIEDMKYWDKTADEDLFWSVEYQDDTNY